MGDFSYLYYTALFIAIAAPVIVVAGITGGDRGGRVRTDSGTDS